MFRYKIFIINIFFFFSASSFAQNKIFDTTIVFGKDSSFTIKVPEFFTVNFESEKFQGKVAVFYPSSSGWQYGISIMYANTASKKEIGTETIQKVIDKDVNSFKSIQEAIILDGENIFTADNKTAVVKKCYDNKFKNYEAVAYIDEDNIVALIVIFSKDINEFEKYYSSFVELVSSYQHLTNKGIKK